MKIKYKTDTMSIYTFNSPYPNENGVHSYENTYACCGNCMRDIEQARFYKEWNYCPYCGVKIDWPEEDEGREK